MRAVLWRTSLYRLPRFQRLRIQNRKFHQSTSVAVSRPPNGSSSSNNHNQASHADEESQSHERDGTQDDGAKEGRHARAVAQRRLNRSGKSTSGIPPPPPIPEWFLKYNVRLQDDEVRLETSTKVKAVHLGGIPPDRTTGFVLPYVEPHGLHSSKELPKLERSGTLQEQRSDLFKEVKGELSHSAGGIGMTLIDTKGSSNEGSSPARNSEGSSSTQEEGEKESSPKESTLSRMLSQLQGAPQQSERSGKDTNHTKLGVESLPIDIGEFDAQTWVRLQGQVLLASAFELAEKVTGNDSITLPRHLHFRASEPYAHDELDRFVEDIADLAHANLLRLDASDVAEMAGQYVDPVNEGEGTIANFAYDAYEGSTAAPPHQPTPLPGGQSSAPNTESNEHSRDDTELAGPASLGPGSIQGLQSFIARNQQFITQALGASSISGVSIGMPMNDGSIQAIPISSAQSPASSVSGGQMKDAPEEESYELSRWQQLKLEAFLSNLLEAPLAKKHADLSGVPESFLRQKFADKTAILPHAGSLVGNGTLEAQSKQTEESESSVAKTEKHNLARDAFRLQLAYHVQFLTLYFNTGLTHTVEPYEDTLPTSLRSEAGLVVHLRDLNIIRDTQQGEIVLERLMKVVNKRRLNGERIMLVGTSAADHMPVSSLAEAFDDDPAYLDVLYPPSSLGVPLQSTPRDRMVDSQKRLGAGYRRLVEHNLRNIQEEIKRLGVSCADDMFSESDRRYLRLPKGSNSATDIGGRALTHGEVHSIVAFANGFRLTYTTSNELGMAHLASSITILDMIHESSMHTKTPFTSIFNNVQVKDRQQEEPKNEKGKKRVDLEQIRKTASKHEQRLLSGVVDPANIKTTFSDVHANPDTIEALKTITTLSLVRPEAFQYGILANDRLPGLLLYGPPGTGKTLLAKAVAKDSGATVLEVSGAQIYEKYVGEGEKMVRAVFSLAKKLSPCVVFIDEADAIFGSRGQSGNRTTHREIINQFLREWDGMDDHSVFIMVATNRPFDLDDAVLRRLPRRLLVDLPVAKDRQSILGIHLKGEIVDESVSMEKLAEQTPFYSGSDLKNLCVSAALAAVREESELLAQHKGDEGFKLPDRRVLKQEHFDKATQEISASISEDMSSLNAIKKFDEQFGDRRGRRKKSGYGFGDLNRVDEEAARVRGHQDQPRR